MPKFFFLIIWAAFCDTIAKTRLFGVPLSLHSSAPLRNRLAPTPTILAAGKLEIHAINSPQSDNPYEVLYITFFRFAVRSFL